MKILKVILCICLLSFAGTARAQMAYIPDSVFRTFIAVKYPGAIIGDSLDTSHPGIIAETKLSPPSAVKDLTGIVHFINLSELEVAYDSVVALPLLPATLQKFTCIMCESLQDISQLAGTQLQFLSMSETKVDTLPEGLTFLQELFIGETNISDASNMAGYSSLINATIYSSFSLMTIHMPANLVNFECYECWIDSFASFSPGLLSLTITSSGINKFDSLPPSLLYLDLYQTVIDALPPLPPFLYGLWVSECGLDSLPALPATLAQLWAADNQLTSLPVLPTVLGYLDVNDNNLTQLPALPSSLLHLYCSDNLLDSLPSSLSPNLVHLECARNNISNLNQLPLSLVLLYCNENLISDLPPLPAIQSLNCSGNQLTSLDSVFGINLLYLDCRFNQISCLPLLPNNMMSLQAFGNLFSCIPNMPPMLTSDITAICDTSNSTCIAYPEISGTVFDDMNANGILDTGEVSFLNTIVEVTQAGWISGTSSSGFFELNVDTGIYSIVPYPVLYRQITTPAHSATFTNYGQSDSLNDIGYYTIPGINDLRIDIIPIGNPRPGFQSTYYIKFKNVGTTVLSGSIVFSFDTLFTLITSSWSYTVLSNDSIEFSFANLFPFDEYTFTVTLHLASGAPLGTQVATQAVIFPFVNDTMAADNFDSLAQTIIGSFDPNDKLVDPEGVLTTLQVASTVLDYTIRFQNTGTASAVNIEITDSIHPNLDLSTFEITATSHQLSSWHILNRNAVFSFNNIYLPDSTSDEPNSHGFIKYRLKPLASLTAGDVITNQAAIYFDFNAPVMTNTVVTNIISPTGIEAPVQSADAVLFPNPVSSVLNISCASCKNDLHTVRIIDAYGNLINTQRSRRLGHTFKIETGDLTPGLYMIELSSSKGLVRKKFLKM